MRERAIGLVIDLDELERQVRLELVDDQPGAAVAGIDHDLEALELVGRHVAEQVPQILVG